MTRTKQGLHRGLGHGLIAAGLAGAAALGVGVLSGPAVHADAAVVEAAEVASPKLVVVKFHADWCGKCRAMEGPMTKARLALTEEPVLFVRFDFTDESTARQSEYLASLTGYDSVWETHMRKTGFSILVDADTGNMVAELRTPDEAAIESAIREHL